MKRLGSPAALAAGLALLLVANAAILAIAGWNRRGGPAATMTLTGRELSLPEFLEEENSGLSLSLLLADRIPPAVERTAWRKRTRIPRVQHPWLDAAKLRELGFRADYDATDPEAEVKCEREGSRAVFLVLELGGEAWKNWLSGREARVEELRRKVESGAAGTKELQDAEALLALDRAMRSRLFVVDAGLDRESLRQRHPDPARYLLIRGVLSPVILQPEGDAPRLDAVVELLPDKIQVPAALRSRLAPFLPRETEQEVVGRERKEPEAAWPAPVPPRYSAVLAFGRGLQPWLVSVDRGE